jgi:hypothetical protein
MKKLAAYAKLALPKIEGAGGKFLTRGMPFAVKEHGQTWRWRKSGTMDGLIKPHWSHLTARRSVNFDI